MPYQPFSIEVNLSLPEIGKGDTLIIPIYATDNGDSQFQSEIELPDRFLQLIGESRALFQEELQSLGFKPAYKSLRSLHTGPSTSQGSFLWDWETERQSIHPGLWRLCDPDYPICPEMLAD